MSFLLFLIGLAAIIKGADWLTGGAAAIAERYGIPTVVVGLTIVAIGSSAPEFVVSVLSAAKGNADIAIGNVVGSNIFNILGIVGATALVAPIAIARPTMRNDVPFVVLSSLVIAITAYDTAFDPAAPADTISRTDGLLLLCLFAIFISYTLTLTHNTALGATTPRRVGPLWQAITRVVIGLTLLLAGGEGLVRGAVGIAEAAGISQAVIALTVVSIGTSAPELAASLMAARKGDTAMALGNVVGSVIFNVFFVLGAAAAVHPLGLGGITTVDIATLILASAMLWAICRFGKTHLTITRPEGALLLATAVAYYTYLVINA